MGEKYQSKTKGKIPLEKMHPQHIKNAIKKNSKLSNYNPNLVKKLQAELKRRESE